MFGYFDWFFGGFVLCGNVFGLLVVGFMFGFFFMCFNGFWVVFVGCFVVFGVYDGVY